MTEYVIWLGEANHIKIQNSLTLWGYPNPHRPVGDPSVVALRDKRVIGLICIAAQPKAVICDRIAVDPQLSKTGRMLICVRLVEHLESFLRRAGCMWYNVVTDTSDRSTTEYLEDLFSVKPFHVADDITWFRRELV